MPDTSASDAISSQSRYASTPGAALEASTEVCQGPQRVGIHDYYYVGGYYGSAAVGRPQGRNMLRERAERLQREVGLGFRV